VIPDSFGTLPRLEELFEINQSFSLSFCNSFNQSFFLLVFFSPHESMQLIQTLSSFSFKRQLQRNNLVGLVPQFLSTIPSFDFNASDNRFTCSVPDWCSIEGDGSCAPCITCDQNGGDVDGDNVCGVDDNCPSFSNPQQLDSDSPACDGSGEGDPHFVGFHHQSLDFYGLPGQVYNLLSDIALQVDSLSL